MSFLPGHEGDGGPFLPSDDEIGMSQAIPAFTPPAPSYPYQGNPQQQLSAVLASSSSGMPGDSISPVAIGLGVTAGGLLTAAAVTLAVKHFSTSGDKPKSAQATSLSSKPFKGEESAQIESAPPHHQSPRQSQFVPSHQPTPSSLSPRVQTPPLTPPRHPTPPLIAAEELLNRGNELLNLNDLRGAIGAFNEGFRGETDLAPRERVVEAFIHKAFALGRLGLPIEAVKVIAACDDMIENFDTITEPERDELLDKVRRMIGDRPNVELPGFVDPLDGAYREWQIGRLCGMHAENTVFHAFGKKPITQEEFEREVPDQRATLKNIVDFADRDGLDTRVYHVAQFGGDSIAEIDDANAFIVTKVKRSGRYHAVAMVRKNREGFCVSSASPDLDRGKIYPRIPNGRPCTANEALLDYLKDINRTARDVTTFHERVSAQSPEFIAKELLNNGNALLALNDGRGAIKAYDEVVTRLWVAKESALRELVAKALNYKGHALRKLNDLERANKLAYDVVITRFWKAKELALRERVHEALHYKGTVLRELAKPEEEIAAHDARIAQFLRETEPALRGRVARAVHL